MFRFVLAFSFVYWSCTLSTCAPVTGPADISWITGSRLNHAQLDTLGLLEGSNCLADSYHRVISLHDGPGPEAIRLSYTPPFMTPVQLFGLPLANQSNFGRLSKVGNKLVVDAFAAEYYVDVSRPAKRENNFSRHHLSRIELTCQSPIYRISCEARYLFMEPNSRLLKPSWVLIHPLEGRTTAPLNAMSAVIASALTSTAAVSLADVFSDMVNIEYLSFSIPTMTFPCPTTEHWLRTIPVYVESAVLAGLIAAVGGDSTSRTGQTPIVVAGHHIQVPAAVTFASVATAVAQIPASQFALSRFHIVNDARPLRKEGLSGAIYVLVALIVLTILCIIVMAVTRRTYISVLRDAWSAPDGRRMLFGNVIGEEVQETEESSDEEMEEDGEEMEEDDEDDYEDDK